MRPLTPAQLRTLQRLADATDRVPADTVDQRTLSSLERRGSVLQYSLGGAYLTITDAGRAEIAPKKLGRPRGHERPAIRLPEWVPTGGNLLALIWLARTRDATGYLLSTVLVAQDQVGAIVDEALRLSDGWRRPAREALGICGQTWAVLCRCQWLQETLAKYPQRHGGLGHRGKPAAKRET